MSRSSRTPSIAPSRSSSQMQDQKSREQTPANIPKVAPVPGLENYCCRRCKQLGHLASMLQCPLNDKSGPKMFVTREIIEEEDRQEVDQPETDAELSEGEVQEAEEYFARAASPMDAVDIDHGNEPESDYEEVMDEVEVADEFEDYDAEDDGESGNEQMASLRVNAMDDDGSNRWQDEEMSDSDDFRNSYYSTERFGRITVGEIEDWETAEVKRKSAMLYMARVSEAGTMTKPSLKRLYTQKDDEMEALNRPKYNVDETRPLVQFVSIGGLQAFALFDSGCTTQSVSHEFARATGLDTMPLVDPIPLQLGTAGSKSVINYHSPGS